MLKKKSSQLYPEAHVASLPAYLRNYREWDTYCHIISETDTLTYVNSVICISYIRCEKKC